MAEHFWGRQLTVYTSNDGATQMLNAWLALGARMARTDDLDAVLTFLQDRLQCGEGSKAFALGPPPQEIESPGRLGCFALIVAAFAEQLTEEQPDPSLTTIAWDHDLRLLWLAKMLDLLEILADLGSPPTSELYHPRLALSEADQVRCDVNRTRNRQAEALRRGAQPKTIIDLADTMIGLLSRLPSDEWRDFHLCIAHQDRATLLLNEGDTQAAVAEMRLALELERNPEFHAELSAIISDLCGH